MMMDTARLEIMDSQRFDASKRRMLTNHMNLNIQTGLSDEDGSSVSSQSDAALDSPSPPLLPSVNSSVIRGRR
ncbi:hypothetical protein DFH09DRAFT_1310881 [Mycena vulgaris]|nr:hypothetical protein DFH09DRAFT_1310881 [Mycena vulgaris]